MRKISGTCTVTLLSVLAGCAATQVERIDGVIHDYHQVSSQIHLGDTKDRVMAVLGPSQERLAPFERKPAQAFQRDGRMVEILYFRTQRIPDNMTTDDEFTPYIFVDGKLEAIGWTALGVPLTRVSDTGRAMMNMGHSPARQHNTIETIQPRIPGIFSRYTPNAYGPGINADATGRPFMWQPDFGGPALGPITPNAYGPGVGMDATGRPVRPACPPGWVGPC